MWPLVPAPPEEETEVVHRFEWTYPWEAKGWGGGEV